MHKSKHADAEQTWRGRHSFIKPSWKGGANSTAGTWKMLSDACASQYSRSSGCALATMQPRTPGTANSSMSLPLSPHTSTPSPGSPPPLSTCGVAPPQRQTVQQTADRKTLLVGCHM